MFTLGCCIIIMFRFMYLMKVKMGDTNKIEMVATLLFEGSVHSISGPYLIYM